MTYIAKTVKKGEEEGRTPVYTERLGIKCRPYLTSKYLVPLMEKGLIKQTMPEKPSSPKQRYVLS